MAFKDSKASFENRTRFRDEMARFTSHEAAMFNAPLEENGEVASAKVDATFEKAVNLSAQKNKSKIIETKAKIKELKKEEVVIKKELRTKELEICKSKESDQRVQTSKEANTREKKEQKEKSDERFESKDSARFSEKQSELRQVRDQKKEFKKKEHKEKKKQTSKIALGNVLKAKKDISNELGGGGANTGDAFHDGKGGLVGTILEAVNPMHYLKSWLAKIAATIAPTVLLFMTFAIIIVVMVALIFDVLSQLIEIGDAISSFISIFEGDDDVFVNSTLSQEEIDEIVADITCTDTQEQVIRFALSKVGYPYSQEQRTSGNYYDCSSLVYYAWKDSDVDISFGTNYPPTAAEGARLLNEKGKAVAGGDAASFSLQPGDLVYYGGSDNGRYKGIYHVAMYVGNGCAVEALNTRYGVVYQTLRTDNAIMICRPN